MVAFPYAIMKMPQKFALQKIYTNKFAWIVWTNYQILTSERSQIVYKLCVVLENRVPSWEVLS